MKTRAIGNWFFLFSSVCLVWSGTSQMLCAGQSYPSQVRVFGNSSAAPTAPQKIEPAKEADIRQLMDLLGTTANATRVMNSMQNSMRPLLLHAFPPGPYRDRLIQLFLEKLHTKLTAQYILNLAIPVYARYLSDDEIKGLIQFYKTPLGQKWINVQPKVQAEVLPTAHSWGREMGRETMIEVLREHPNLAQELQDAAEAAHRR